MQVRKFEYGHGNAVMVLVAEKLGLSPALVDEAKRTLNGQPIHPITGAALEQEAIRVSDMVRDQGSAVMAQANSLAERLKIQHGFVKPPLLEITTLADKKYVFSPVPMSVMPSGDPALWLKFLGRHAIGTDLSESTQNAIQRFMRKHRSEALTNGVAFYTLAGGMLAWCDPDVV